MILSSCTLDGICLVCAISDWEILELSLMWLSNHCYIIVAERYEGLRTA